MRRRGRGAGSPSPEGSAHPTVAHAIQRLAAARLGRAFVPLGVLVGMGVAQALTGRGGLLLAAGAPLAALAMLGYGLRVVQGAFGRPRRPWMALAALASVVPPAYALWVLGWLGLRGLASAGGIFSGGWAAAHLLVGIWLLRGWMRLLELSRLAEAMSAAAPAGEGPPP